MYQPKERKDGQYSSVPRFKFGESVTAHGYGLGEGEFTKLSKCLTIKLTGANELLTAGAFALGGLALTLI
jgi:hypothetical protein